MIGRTSMRPLAAVGIFAAFSMASSERVAIKDSFSYIKHRNCIVFILLINDKYKYTLLNSL
jgi:hypothetical protein